MKPILKQAVWLIGSLAFLYVVILGVTLLVVPLHSQEGGLDTARAPHTLYMTEPKYLFLNRAPLKAEADRLILLGASNMVAGFRPPELQPLLPGLQVNNLSVSGSNVTEMRQAYEMIRAVQTPENLKRGTYVIGIWYGVFVPDEIKWHTPDRHAGETDLDIERFRYGFYRRSAAGPVQILPTEDLDLGLLLIHPYLAFDKLVRDGTDDLRASFLKMKPSKSDSQKNAIVITPQAKERYFALWRNQFGSFTAVPREQFDVLTALVDDILQDGGKVVVADLPIPSWLAQESPFNQSYEPLKAEWLQQMSDRKGFTFVEMQNAFPDDEFVDEVHPKPRITKEWSKLLAASIDKDVVKTGSNP